MSNHVAHPYMANSVPAIKQEMLDSIGVDSIEELFQQIPNEHRLQRPIDLPPALNESELRRHLLSTLSKNKTCEQTLTSWAPAVGSITFRQRATKSCAVMNG